MRLPSGAPFPALAPMLTLMLTLMLALLAMQGCAPKTSRPWVDPRLAADEAAIQRDMAVREMSEKNSRLNRVGARILTGGAGLCGEKVQPYSGIHALTLDAVDSQWREAAGKLHGLDRRIRIIDVIEDTPAARAGLSRGDAVVALDGRPTGEGAEGFKAFQKDLESLARKGAFTLSVEREGNRTDATVIPEKACAFPVEFVEKDEVNAYADGRRILVTQGMVRFCEKDEDLALVLGHELAHNAMGHITAKAGNRLGGAVADALIAVIFGVYNGGVFARQAAQAYSHDFEAEADYVGLYFAARAGYDLANAAYFWRRMAVAHPRAIGHNVTHPSTAFRFAGIEAARGEINTKMAQGRPLEPEMQQAEARKEERPVAAE